MLKFMSYLFYSYFPTCDITYHDIVNHINVEWLSQRLFILRTRDRKLRTVIIYDVYITYWAFDEHLKPCCCNGYSRSQMKKNACTALLRVLRRRLTHVSTPLCAA